MTCTPLPEYSVSQVVGPSGGTLAVGPHSFIVPAGALSSWVRITAVAPSDSVNRVHFRPEGLTFKKPASLTMSYANCKGAGSLLKAQIAYTDDLLQILYYVPSVPDYPSKTVTGQIDHFSDYATAW